MSTNGPQITLSELFGAKVFRIPEFQRAYAWEIDPNLNDFINDLINHPNPDSKRFYLGTFLLTAEDVNKRAAYKTFAVVDGQQR